MKYTKEEFSEGLKKIILAGIGALAYTTEKAKDIIDDLAKKGEITVEQGKILSEELKHDVSKRMSRVEVTVHESNASPIESVMDHVKDMTEEEIAELKAKLDEYKFEEEPEIEDEEGQE